MQLILCNCPTVEVATQISQRLLEQRLIACANLLPAVRSMYHWQGELETSEEIPLLLKARIDDYPAIEQAIVALHPYKVPEIVALPLSSVLACYKHWLYEETLRD